MLQRYVSKIIKNSLSSRHYASVCYKGTSRHCNDTGNTIQHHMCELEQRFAERNMLEAVCDIKFLIAKAIGLKTLEGVPLTRQLTQAEVIAIHDMAKRRLQRVPVQYVIGEWDFRDLTLDLKPPVFIPRPETEELVENILEDDSIHSAETFLEIGPGSGAISLSLLNSLPHLRGVAIDKSKEACNLTKHNAEKLGLHERLTVQQGEIGKDIFEDISTFDLLISNPPYIPGSEIKKLQPEILLFEDHGALDGGEDGLEIVRAILKCVPNLLKPNSSVWLEVDYRHPDKIQNLLADSEYQNLQVKYEKTFKDFNSLPRFCQLRYEPT